MRRGKFVMCIFQVYNVLVSFFALFTFVILVTSLMRVHKLAPKSSSRCAAVTFGYYKYFKIQFNKGGPLFCGFLVEKC